MSKRKGKEEGKRKEEVKVKYVAEIITYLEKIKTKYGMEGILSGFECVV